MAQTGQLGTVDSLLANVQPAFTAADPVPPSITTESGVLGGQLGDVMLALGGEVGPLTFNLSAESVLALAQTADPAPTFVAHPSPHWALGGHDSQLGATEPAFTGEAPADPTITAQTGRLGWQLGETVPGLTGVVGPHVICMTAESVLAIAQAADPAPTFVAHVSPRWALGGRDSCLGGVELAFTGAPVSRPLTGSQTGKLGTVDSLLGEMRLVLGLQEGDVSSIEVSAESALSLTSAASAGIARERAASSTLILTATAARNNLLTSSSESVLALTGAADCAAVRTVAAENTLGLTGVAGRNNPASVSAESAINAEESADCAAVRPLTAENTLELTSEAAGVAVHLVSAESVVSLDAAGSVVSVRTLAAENTLSLATEADRNNLPNRSAESVLSLDSESDVAAVRLVSAESALDLSVAAGRNSLLSAAAESTISASAAAGFTAVRTLAAASTLGLTSKAEFGTRTVFAESSLSLEATAECAVVRLISAENTLDLTATVGRNNLLTAGAESTLVLSAAAGRNNLLSGIGESILSLDTAAEAAAVRSLSAESVLGLDAAAGRNSLLEASAESTISLVTTAGGMTVRPASAETTLELTGEAEGVVVRSSSAESTLTLESAANVQATLFVSAASALSLTTAATHNNRFVVSAGSTLSLTSAAAGGRPLQAEAASELELTDEAACTHKVGHRGECWDFLPVWHEAAVSVVRALAAESAIALVHTEHTARPWYVSAETPVQISTPEYDPEVDDIVWRLEGLQDVASAARPLTAAAQHSIPLHQTASAVRVKPTAIDVSAESVLELLGEVRTNQTGKAGDWLVLRQEAAVDRCKLVKSALNLSQEAAVIVSVPRGAASALRLRQAATYSIVSRSVLQRYKPFVGEGPEGAPTPPSVTIGPPEHVALPFQLFYPAEGVVTDFVQLRAPNLGNKDRLGFNRILRETRGGTLIVFADPIWPKIQTLVLTFSGLRSVQTQQLLTFLETHLGEEIGLIDWEGRAWKGIVTSPTEPVVQDGKDSFSASLEFEGELLPA